MSSMQLSENFDSFDRTTITSWFNTALTCQSVNEKLEYLHKIQEFVINKSPDLLSHFLPSFLAFTSDRNTDIKKCVVGFIEEACKKNEEIIPQVMLNLHMLLCDEAVQVQKRVIKASGFIYRIMLMWLCRASMITEAMEQAWNQLNQIKVEIVNMIDSDNDGVRTHSIKFLEGVIMLQTYPDSGVTRKTNDFSLEDVPLTLKIARRRKLEEEACHIFSLLIKFHGSPHISSVNLMACMGSLCTIAKSRPEFMSRVVTAMENLNSNLPPTLSHSQVSSVRKHLKMQLLNILKHPACGESRSMVMQLLIDLGYTNQELAKLAPRPPIEEKKRIPKRSLEPSTIPQLYNKKAKFNEDLDKIEEIEKLKHEASEVNESFILQNLNNNMVINIIVASMKNFPSTIPGHFPGDYSRAIANGTDLVQIAKLLAEQFTEADVGPGIKIYNSKEHGIEQKINERIDSPKQEVENGGNTKALLDKLNREIKKASPGVNSVRPVKVKTLKLSEITKPLPNRVRDQMLIDTVKRVLQAEKYLVKVGVTHTRHKIVTTFASMFSSAVQEVILHFLLEDLRSHMDLALAWLYEEYSRMQGFCRTPAILRREEKPDQSYNALLCSLISSLQKGNELLKDRDGLMARLYLEAPFVTNEALELLKQQCMRVERSPSALNLVHDLVVRRPPCGASFLHALLSLTIFADATIREGAVARIVSIYERSEWRQTIEDFALQHLEALRLPEPPADNNPTEETAPNTWTDELAKANLCLYMALLPYNESLVHELSRIYVQTSADVKRTILRLLEQPVRGMGMDSPELLLLVERCPKGAETLVTRIIHILSDRGPPSAQLVSRVRELYHSRVSDVRFLIPVLNGLTKKEITSALPKLIKLNPVVVKEVFNRLLGLHGGGDPPISPSELLIALHLLDPAKVEIKSIMKATSLCFAEKQVYTQEVLAVVMQQLMDVTPLPTLLMRTVIQSLTLYPRLTGFVMNILQRLIVKQVWRQKVVWEGFIKCCQRTKPQSFQVLLQLPHAQLSEALTVCPDMLLPLQEHVRSLTETQRAHIPSSVMDVILGANNNSSPSDAISSAAAANITSDLAVDTPMIPSPTTPVNIEPGSIEPLPPGME